jgi:hypothetical protein
VTTPIVNLPNGPFAAGSTPVITGQLTYVDGSPVMGTRLLSLTLTIADVGSGAVIISDVNILNTDRGDGRCARQCHHYACARRHDDGAPPRRRPYAPGDCY